MIPSQCHFFVLGTSIHTVYKLVLPSSRQCWGLFYLLEV